MKTKKKPEHIGGQYNVFVIEDSDVYRTLLIEYISKIKNSLNPAFPGYVIYGFPSGEAALENLHLGPDVVVLDYRLDSGGYSQNMDGLMILKKLKKLSPVTEVIVLSCQASAGVIKELLRSGASYFIKKDNFSQIRISHLIENFIRKREKMQRVKKINYVAAGIFLAVLIAAVLWYYIINK